MKLLQDIAFFEGEGRPHKELFLAVQIEAGMQQFITFFPLFRYWTK